MQVHWLTFFPNPLPFFQTPAQPLEPTQPSSVVPPPSLQRCLENQVPGRKDQPALAFSCSTCIPLTLSPPQHLIRLPMDQLHQTGATVQGRLQLVWQVAMRVGQKDYSTTARLRVPIWGPAWGGAAAATGCGCTTW